MRRWAPSVQDMQWYGNVTLKAQEMDKLPRKLRRIKAMIRTRHYSSAEEAAQAIDR